MTPSFYPARRLTCASSWKILAAQASKAVAKKVWAFSQAILVLRMLACFMRSDSEECATEKYQVGLCTYAWKRLHHCLDTLIGTRITILSCRGFVANVSVRESGREQKSEMNYPPFSIFFLLPPQLSRNNSIRNACYASCERSTLESVKILSSPCLSKGGRGSRWIKHGCAFQQDLRSILPRDFSG